jgi:Fe(3+) dicitrate transport protein
MISKVYFKILVIFLLFSETIISQQIFSGYIIDKETNKTISDVKVYSKSAGLLEISDEKGFYSFEAYKDDLISFYLENYDLNEKTLEPNETIYLQPQIENLDEIEIIVRNEKIFSLHRLNAVEGTGIYEGKKSEVVLVDQSMANLASNNSRQIYSQVAGLNIFQNDDAGLQLNIGGRGLDPNRTSNFNTRQNGYDISADVLGYPESYYTPPSEGLSNIQIVRGAASLQYGTQFGGLVNFVMKEPIKNQREQFIIRNSVGSNKLYTNFTSYMGSKNKFRYYAYFNFKEGDGFRDNSSFNSKNFFIKTIFDINQESKLSFDLTYFTYLTQQAGGLNDQMFSNNPFQSNRARNWFNVDWLLYNLRFDHEFDLKKSFSVSFFGLNSVRNALGFRVNRVDQVDSNGPRDLISGDFNNFGLEAKFLNNYKLLNKESIFVLGSKIYYATNYSRQGPGSDLSDADFSFYNDTFPTYSNQSNYKYPNKNISVFGENIINISDELTITPGFRLEYINTQARGQFERIILDAAQNVIQHDTILENRKNERLFLLTGVGISKKLKNDVELYANYSQNYRSVTFADISTVNPAYAIDPEISDENGYTIDLGLRGNYDNFFSFDANIFHLAYNNRIGFVQRLFDDGNVKAYRTNTGDANTYGLESLVDINLKKLFGLNSTYIFNTFLNLSIIESEYIKSEEPGVEGKEVEFVPKYNIKYGIKFGYKNFTSYLQYSYLASQFSDSSNSVESNLSGVIGQIPAYDILDFSMNYKLGKIKLETGVNNILDNSYFTRRATGYPGPGIIPSPPRNYYFTLQYKF